MGGARESVAHRHRIRLIGSLRFLPGHFAAITPSVLVALAKAGARVDAGAIVRYILADTSLQQHPFVMARNVEIKARVPRPSELLDAILDIADRGPTIFAQDDTFFACPNGRLKLRMFSPSEGQLIFYRRDDASGPKLSEYLITATVEPDALRGTLGLAYGIVGRVRKTRTPVPRRNHAHPSRRRRRPRALRRARGGVDAGADGRRRTGDRRGPDGEALDRARTAGATGLRRPARRAHSPAGRRLSGHARSCVPRRG